MGVSERLLIIAAQDGCHGAMVWFSRPPFRRVMFGFCLRRLFEGQLRRVTGAYGLLPAIRRARRILFEQKSRRSRPAASHLADDAMAPLIGRANLRPRYFGFSAFDHNEVAMKSLANIDTI